MSAVTNEDLYAAMVAVLSKLIDAEKRSKGTTRLGGDYSSEAVQLIKMTKRQLGHS